MEFVHKQYCVQSFKLTVLFLSRIPVFHLETGGKKEEKLEHREAGNIFVGKNRNVLTLNKMKDVSE